MDMVCKILIIKLGAMGDVLRTTSFLKGISEKYPGCEIEWITKNISVGLLKNNPYIKKLYSYNTELKEELKGKEYDIVLSFDEEYEACEIASAVKEDKIIGAYLENNKETYTDSVAEWFDMGLISKFGKKRADELKIENKRTYQDIMCDILGVEKGKPILQLEESNINFADNFKDKNNIKDDNLVIGLNTGSGIRWKLKRWPLDKTVEIADKLTNELNAKVILFGGPEEVERNQKIIQSAKTEIVDAGCNNNHMDFAALVNICDIVVVSDTLALHVAVSLNKKVIALFGPTSAAEIDLYGKGKKLAPDIDCITCYKRECENKPNCMEQISVEEVFNVIKELK